MRTWKCLDNDRRIAIETLLKAGHTKKEIATIIGCHLSTVYRELKRGKCVQLDTYYREYYVYSAYAAHDRAKKARKNCGAPLKYITDTSTMEYFTTAIKDNKFSPAAAIAQLQSKSHLSPCKDTVYRYIHRRYFDELRPRHLPEKGIRKHPYKKEEKQNKKKLGTSIEDRPTYINDRNTFGHWEMDCVIGSNKGIDQAALVLTERYTRAELCFKLPRKTAENVTQIIDQLYHKGDFSRIFKTITMDNGAEFSHSQQMEFTKTGKRRTYCYYCHPYTSCERGSNENANRLIRRWLPKGKSLSRVTNEDCISIARWMNNYPRKILNWKTPAQRFLEECEKENIKISSYFSQFLS